MRRGLAAIALAILICAGFLVIKSFQYDKASKLFRETAEFPVGMNLSSGQIRLIETRPCALDSPSMSQVVPGAEELTSRCQVVYLSRSGLRYRTLEIELVLNKTTLLSKSAFMFYGDMRASGIKQSVRGFGYPGSLDASVPNRSVEEVKYSDGTYKSMVLREDDTVSVDQRNIDWNLNLRCMWDGTNCSVVGKPKIDNN